MGQEIVYCFRCQTRLLGSDFDKGVAFKLGGKVACLACAQQVLPTLSAAEQESIRGLLSAGSRKGSSDKFPAMKPPTPPAMAKPASTTRLRAPQGRRTQSIPVASAPQPEKKTGLVLGLVGGGAVLLVVVLVVALTGSPRPPAASSELEPSEPAAAAPAPKAAAKPAPPPEDPSRSVLQRLRDFARARPQDLAGQVREYEQALSDIRDPRLLEEARKELEATRQKQRAVIVPEFSALEDKLRPFLDREEFRRALEEWERERSRHDVGDWRNAVDKKMKEIRDKADAAYRAVKEKAGDARRRAEAAELKSLRDRVAKWGLDPFLQDFDRLFAGPAPAAVAPPPPPPDAKPASKEASAYHAGWRRAMAHASSREYDAALRELEGASKSLTEADVRAESARDAALLKRVTALHAEATKTLTQWPRWSPISLEVREGEGMRQTLIERVVRAEPTRMEITRGRGLATAFVEYSELLPEMLAEVCRDKAGKSGPEDLRALAVFCLLEGGDDTSVARVGADPGDLPRKYVDYSRDVRTNPPKPASRDAEARKLFAAAEREWRDPATRVSAIEKYRALREDYAAAPIVTRYKEAITSRGDSGKDYLLGAAGLKGSGEFQPSSSPKLESCWTVARDVTLAPLETHVEFEFLALADTAYKCWVYLGGCCTENFRGYYQGTEVTAPDPENKKVMRPAEPGATHSVSLGLPSGLRSHARHDGGKAKKEPLRWEWVAVPLPKYASAGPKKLRILGEVQGFSVGAAVVSSTRRGPPREADLAEALKAAPAAAAAPASGTPDPAAWLTVGPFPNGWDEAFPPEQQVNLAGKYPTRSGDQGWMLAFPEVRANRCAVFDFKGQYSPKDDVVAYAAVHVKSPSAQDARLLLGSDDSVKVWVNGALVHTNGAKRGVKIDDDEVAVKLKAGWNRLLFKVAQWGGDWGLCARVADARKNPLPGLEFDPFGDLPR